MTTSAQKVTNRLNAAAIPFKDIGHGMLAVDPRHAAALRNAFVDQPHYIKWLNRDYRASYGYYSAANRGLIIHKGALSKPRPLSPNFASTVPGPSITHSGNAGNHSGESFVTQGDFLGVVDARFAAHAGPSINGGGIDRGKPIVTTTLKRQLGGVAFAPRATLVVEHYRDYMDYAAGESSRQVWPYQTRAFTLKPDGSGLAADNERVYASVADMQNWLLVTGPSALTVGEFHPCGFAWVWATNNEVANVLESSLEHRQGKERINLESEIAKLRASAGGLGVIRGTSDVNPYVMHDLTARYADDLWSKDGIEDGMNFGGLKEDWLSGRWLPIGAKAAMDLEDLILFYEGTTWTVGLNTDGDYEFVNLDGYSSQVCNTFEQAAQFAKELAWGKALLNRGADATIRAFVPRTAEIVAAHATPGDYVQVDPPADPGPERGDAALPGKSAVEQLLNVDRPTEHPANALCNPAFTAAY